MLLELDRFKCMMEEIDSSLVDEQFDIASRPMHAIMRILDKLNIDAPISGASVQSATLPITVMNISSHVTNWYNELYEDILKVDFSLAKFPFLIRGGTFEVKVPLTYGQILVVANKTAMLDNQILNVVDMIQGLPLPIRERLTSKDESHLQAYFETCHRAVSKMAEFKDSSFIVAALKDSFVSCENLNLRPKSPDLSAWHSAQFAEKVMKFFISQKATKVQRTHNFKDLLKSCEQQGYRPDSRINWKLLSSVTPSSRYEPGLISVTDALSINIEAWRVVFDVMHQKKS